MDDMMKQKMAFQQRQLELNVRREALGLGAMQLIGGRRDDLKIEDLKAAIVEMWRDEQELAKELDATGITL